MLASLLHVSQPHTYSHAHSPHSPQSEPHPKDAVDVQITPILGSIQPDRSDTTTMDKFLAEVKALFEAPLQAKSLHAMSRQLQKEFREKLKASKICMLPSFHHTLPTGQEQGTILALDVGGSTFRIALIDLTGRQLGQDDGMDIKQLKSFPIDDNVRSLRGRLFFDWMACRIEEVLDADHHQADSNADVPLPMALAWSFPIEQTSTRTGSLLAMGKGFLATAGVEGQDICELVTSACQARKINVALHAIVNDSAATLLSQAYRDPSTRISLIMGTGINAAVYLPVDSLDQHKFGQREQSWWEEAKHVLVNTELSMFGKNVWMSTRWDDELNRTHPMPDFQPLEYKAGGRFLGEIVRLVLVEAVSKGVLFGGNMPNGLDDAYALDTGLVGLIESDSTSHLTTSIHAFTAAHPLPKSARATPADLHFIRAVSTLVTTRSSAYVATAVHALWELQKSTASKCQNCRHICHSHLQEKDDITSSSSGSKQTVTIACNGSIMEKYPAFKPRCQAWLDELAVLSEGASARRSIAIEMANESSVYGAAVAAAEITSPS